MKQKKISEKIDQSSSNYDRLTAYNENRRIFIIRRAQYISQDMYSIFCNLTNWKEKDPKWNKCCLIIANMLGKVDFICKYQLRSEDDFIVADYSLDVIERMARKMKRISNSKDKYKKYLPYIEDLKVRINKMRYSLEEIMEKILGL